MPAVIEEAQKTSVSLKLQQAYLFLAKQSYMDYERDGGYMCSLKFLSS